MIAPVVPAPEPAAPQPGLLERVSASRLGLFHQCRLKFYFRYVRRLKKTKSAALHVGSAVHAVLQYWNKARWRREEITEEKLQKVFVEKWVEGQKGDPVRWDDSEQEEKDGAWKLVQMYLKETPIPVNERPVAVEVKVEADLAAHGLPKLLGIMDLVRAGGKIVDFKTAAQTPNPDKALHLHETQLACYGLLYRAATGEKEAGLELHHLVKLKTPKLVVTTAGPVTQVQETRLFRSIESFVRGVEAEDWVPSPNVMSCSCCEYFNECRAWH